MLAYIALYRFVILIERKKSAPYILVVGNIAVAESDLFTVLKNADIPAESDALGIFPRIFEAEALTAIKGIGDRKRGDAGYIDTFYTKLTVKTLDYLHRVVTPSHIFCLYNIIIPFVGYFGIFSCIALENLAYLEQMFHCIRLKYENKLGKIR